MGLQVWCSGGDQPEKTKVKPITNEYFVKPKGGIWTSSYQEEGTFPCDWFSAAVSMDLMYMLQKCWLLEPQEARKIYHIDSYQDLVHLLEKYQLQSPERMKHLDPLINNKYIDFEAFFKDYDGLHLTAKGQYETRFSRPHLYGWDAESTLWNKFGFKVIKELDISKCPLPEDDRDVSD